MALTKTFPTQDDAGLPITDTRRVLSGLVVRNADGSPRAGIFPAGTDPIVTGRASMGYDVAPFTAATSRIDTGIELVANDAVTVVPTTAAPGANSRIDVIWVRAQFVQHADASNLPEFGVTQGTAAPIPAKPSIPPGALELATAEILSTTTTTATAVITQTHAYTAAAGGTVLFRNKTQLDEWTPADVHQSAVTADTHLEYMYDGSAWMIRPGTILAAGKANVTTAVNGATLLIIDTPVLPIGQKVIIGPTRLSASVSGGGTVSGTLRWINTGATVTSATGEAIAIRGYVGNSNVLTLPPITTLFTTTAEQKVSAGLFMGGGTSYNVDGQELTIVAA